MSEKISLDSSASDYIITTTDFIITDADYKINRHFRKNY